mgnify:CR=1 FL=1
MNFIPTPSQADIVKNAVNTKEFQKWVINGKVDRFTIECEISMGGLEYCEGMIEMLKEVKCYGYKKAVAVLTSLID